MNSELLASRLAYRLRIPALIVAAISAVFIPAQLISKVAPDSVVLWAATGVGAATAAMFFCALLDRRFHNALSALSAEWRSQARTMSRGARIFGLGFPHDDRLLFGANVLLIVEFLACGFAADRSAMALAFAASGLVTMFRVALGAATYPTAKFAGYFLADGFSAPANHSDKPSSLSSGEKSEDPQGGSAPPKA